MFSGRVVVYRFLVALMLAFSCRAQAPAASGELDRAADVRALSPEAAAERRPVRLRGHLVLITASRNALVLLDSTDGIYVALGNQVKAPFQPGDELEVQGESEAGDFAPIVRARSVERVGTGALPAPRPTTLAELNAGGFDAAWVELSGIVRACRPAPIDRLPNARGSWLATFAQGDDRMDVRIDGPVDPLELVDAKVRLRGVVFNVHNAHRQFVRASLQVAGRSMVEVLSPPPADPFALPVQRVSEVLRFSQSGFTGRRVHVQGVVIGHREGLALWVREGDRGMQIASTQPGRLAPGDVVDVVGFPDHGGYTPSLSDAVFRRVSDGPTPAPLPLNRPEDISRCDANLVQIDAELREARPSSDGLQLVMNWRGLEVHGRLGLSPGENLPSAWQPGSVLRVAGLCSAGQTDFLRSTGLWVANDLQLWIRAREDVVLLQRAPWWTTRRAAAVAFGVSVAALLALAGMALVARRQIAQRETARRLAEVEFAAMLAERNRMAREIHDTLAQDLNAASMQLELARNAAKSGGGEAATPFLSAAHQIVRQCLAGARESIWDMRSHILERQDLVSALGSVAEQLRGGGACEIRTHVHGRPRRLAPSVENNLLRIGQEAVSNALKHAQPRAIELEFNFEPSSVRLAITDDGSGLSGAGTTDTAGHFGMRGMRERVAQLHGKLHLGPGPKGGTRVEVVVDAPSPA